MLKDTKSLVFIIFKSLYHTSFKLSNVNFSRDLPLVPSWTNWGGHSTPRSPAVFHFPIHAKRRIYFLCGYHSVFMYIYTLEKEYTNFKIYSVVENIFIFIWFTLWLQRNLLYSFEAQCTTCKMLKNKLAAAALILHLPKEFKKL